MKYLKKMIDKYTNSSEVAKATFWFFACNILLKCISLLTTPIFTRLLTTEQFGIYNTYVSWTQIVTIIATFRLDYGIFNKGMSQYSDAKDDYTATMQSITSFITTILFLIYLLFKDYFNQLTGLSTFLSVALFLEVFFTNALSFWAIRQRYDFKYRAAVSLSLAMVFCNTFLGIFAVILTNYSGMGRILSIVLTQCCFGIIIYVINYKKAKRLFVKDYAKFAILFNIPLLPHYFASYILDQFDRIMIMKLVDYSAVGIYSIAYSSGFVIKIITSSLNNTLIPWQYRKLKEQDFESISKCVYSIIHCVLLCFLGYMAFAPEIIKIMASPEYYEAIYVLPPVTASVFLIFLYELYANVEFFYNANKATMYIAIIGAVINIVLNYIFIPRFGYVMAAYTTLASYCYFTISHFVYMKHVVSKHTGQKKLFSTKSLCISMLLIISYTLFINILFDYSIIRYGLIATLTLYAIIRRKELFKFLSVLK